MINFLDEDITRCQESPEESSAEALGQTRFNTTLIQSFEALVKADLHVIRQRGSPEWLRTADANLRAMMDATQETLIHDYEDLVSRFQDLIRRCEVSAGLLLSAVSFLQTQKSIEEAHDLAKLTQLAFIFVPLTVIVGVFGMNVKEYQESFPPLWTFFVVALFACLGAQFLAMSSSRRQAMWRKLSLKRQS